MRSTMKLSYALRFGISSASWTLASASLYFLSLIRFCAACSGVATSARAVSLGAAAAAAGAAGAAGASSARAPATPSPRNNTRPIARPFARAIVASDGTAALAPRGEETETRITDLSGYYCIQTTRTVTACTQLPARSRPGATRPQPTLCLLNELLVANQADLGHAYALRRCHDFRDVLVGRQLVGAQVHFGLVELAGHVDQVLLEAGPVRDRGAIPVDRAVEVHVNRDHNRRPDRRRRIAHRHVQVYRVQLDRNGDDQHDQQHQHHIDQRSGVDVDHYVRIVRVAPTDLHRHDCILPYACRRRTNTSGRLFAVAPPRPSGCALPPLLHPTTPTARISPRCHW